MIVMKAPILMFIYMGFVEWHRGVPYGSSYVFSFSGSQFARQRTVHLVLYGQTGGNLCLVQR